MAESLASPDQLKNKNTYKNANRITYYEDETTKKRYYKCPICSKMLSGHVTMHMKNVHFGADSWPCEVCGKNLASESSLKAHMPIHEPEKRFKCAHCGKGFGSKMNLQRHIPRHLTPLQCTDCQQQFSSKKLLDEHRSVHTEETLLCEPYVCEEEDCAKEFAEEHLLNQHIHEHTMSQFPYDCEKCPERFSKKIELKRHEKVSHDEGYEETYRHACDMCSRRYKKKSDLTYHKKQVHNDDPDSLKKHQCSECPKKFLRKTDLNIHMVVHSTEQNFECEECGKKFKLQKSLKRHQEKENHAAGEKQPFWCKFCKTAHSSALDLSQHMILSHAKCLICSEQLANKKRLNVHMNTVHCELFTVPPTN